MPKVAREPPAVGEKHGTDSLSQPTDRTNLAYIFISNFQPPELQDNKFLF